MQSAITLKCLCAASNSNPSYMFMATSISKNSYMCMCRIIHQSFLYVYGHINQQSLLYVYALLQTAITFICVCDASNSYHSCMLMHRIKLGQLFNAVVIGVWFINRNVCGGCVSTPQKQWVSYSRKQKYIFTLFRETVAVLAAGEWQSC